MPESNSDSSAASAITGRIIYAIAFAIGSIFAVTANYIYTIDIGARTNLSSLYLMVATAAIILAPLRQLEFIKVDEGKLRNRVMLYVTLGMPQGFALISLLIITFRPYF